jgi:hypothetical protein
MRILPQALHEMSLRGLSISERRFNTAKMKFGSVPVFFIASMEHQLEQPPGFIEIADIFQVRRVTINDKRTGIAAAWFHVSDILQAFENAVQKIVAAHLDKQFGCS